jgi:hypothetical protein
MKKEEPTVLEAPDLVAYIISTTTKKVRPFLRKSDHRVCFAFDEDVSDEIQKFYDENTTIPVSDYCRNLKMIRSMIFTLKGGR